METVTVVVDSRPLVGKAAKSIKLPPARIENDQKSGKNKYHGVGYRVDRGEVDNFGNVKLPIVYGTDVDLTATVYSNYDSTVYVEIPIHVQALKVQIIPRTIPELRSEQKVPLLNYITVKDDVEKKGLSFLCTQAEITDNGVLTAPQAFGAPIEIEVTVISKADNTVTEVFTVTINPVKIEVGFEPPIIHAGGKKVNFQITTLNDPRGNKDFSLKLSPNVGEISALGVYTPPKFISQPETVKLTATAKYDESIEKTIQFELRPPLCSCGEEVNEDGICPVCNIEISTGTGSSINECPECHAQLVNGICKECGFPSPCDQKIV